MVSRVIMIALAVLGLALTTTSCGKRGQLERPEPATYPRQYPPA